jgi:hypothetical protein
MSDVKKGLEMSEMMRPMVFVVRVFRLRAIASGW